jgi:hypothetical protein
MPRSEPPLLEGKTASGHKKNAPRARRFFLHWQILWHLHAGF